MENEEMYERLTQMKRDCMRLLGDLEYLRKSIKEGE